MVPSLQVVISCGCVGHTCGGCTSPWWDSGLGYPRNIRLGHMTCFLIICTFEQICFVFVLQSIYMTFQNIQYILCPFPHNFTLTVRYIYTRVIQQYYIIISAEACRGIPSLLHRVRFASVHGRPEALRKAYKPRSSGIQVLPPPIQYWGRVIYLEGMVLPALIKHWGTEEGVRT